MKIRALLLLVTLGVSSSLAKAQLIGLYELNGSFANGVAGEGALGSLTEANFGAATTGFAAGAWTWSGAGGARGTGLQLSLGEALTSYSVGIAFQFSQVDGYRRVLDFTNGLKEFGIYVSSGLFEPYLSSPANAGGTIAANTLTTLVLTREETGHYRIYVNDSPVYVVDEQDTGSDLVGETVFFAVDDGSSEFSEGGSISEIRVWQNALSAGEISTAFAAVPSAVPEPSTYALMAGAAALGLAVWRRRSFTKTSTR